MAVDRESGEIIHWELETFEWMGEKKTPWGRENGWSD